MPRRSHDVGAEDDATEGANAPGWQAVKSEHIGNLRASRHGRETADASMTIRLIGDR